MCDKTHSEGPNAGDDSWNKSVLIISSAYYNQRTVYRTECLATLRYCKVSAKWVPRMPTHAEKDHRYVRAWWPTIRLKVTVSSSVLSLVTRYSHTTMGQQQQVCTLTFGKRKEVMLPDFMEFGKTINTDPYIITLMKLKIQILRFNQRRQSFICNMTMPDLDPVLKKSWIISQILSCNKIQLYIISSNPNFQPNKEKRKKLSFVILWHVVPMREIN